MRGAATCAPSTRCRHVVGAANTDGVILSSILLSTPGCAHLKNASFLEAEWYLLMFLRLFWNVFGLRKFARSPGCWNREKQGRERRQILCWH
jgi:hypothetical protein